MLASLFALIFAILFENDENVESFVKVLRKSGFKDDFIDFVVKQVVAKKLFAKFVMNMSFIF